MPRRKLTQDERDSAGVELSPPVTPAQLRQLARIGYRSAWPSTSDQAAEILARYKGKRDEAV